MFLADLLYHPPRESVNIKTYIVEIWGGGKLSLKELRKRAGLLQEDVARKMDVTQAAVSKWESGDTRCISRKYRKKLAKLYGVTEDELLAAFEMQTDGSVVADSDQAS